MDDNDARRDGFDGWSVCYSTGPAKQFHDRTPAPASVARASEDASESMGQRLDDHLDNHYGHEVWIHQVQRTAVVLGSTQRLDLTGFGGANSGRQELQLFDRNGESVELCSRRSGGGLVVVDPDNTVWVDVIVPSWSPLHHGDVSKSFLWLGQVWRRTLQAVLGDAANEALGWHATSGLGIDLAEPASNRRAADRPFFCFDGIGHGELLVSGKKVVGISQRRTRHWARLQSLVALRWNADAINQIIEPIRQVTVLGSLGQPPYDANDVKAGLDPRWPAPDPAALVAKFVDLLPAVI